MKWYRDEDDSGAKKNASFPGRGVISHLASPNMFTCMASPRPPFSPVPCDSTTTPLTNGWTSLLSCPIDFPLEIFEIAVLQLIHHPEYNSTLILRSEIIEDTDTVPEGVPSFDGGRRAVRCIRRRLLPRRPGRDAAMEQYCTFYAEHCGQPDTIVLTPIGAAGALPYYHPAVSHLAFHCTPFNLRIDVLPLPSTPTDLASRLYRTCLALLETVHRYAWGAVTNYRKRVMHDCLVPREAYQDLYLVMRERHRHLVDTWREVTDPLKHVFEDIGIATYLMLLWKDTFPPAETVEENSDEPWKTWPRPPGGFLDFGCGNGLLTHILTAEGYSGSGIDLRARSSWSHYPASTQAALAVYAFDPSTLVERDEESGDTLTFPPPPGSFIIANHADELTPWTPVLATLYDAVGYISIPCCAWGFDARYERSRGVGFGDGDDGDGDGSGSGSIAFIASLNLGAEGTHKSSYSKYRIWLARLSAHCGWRVESEVLRIPSTRNWAVVGRSKGHATPQQAKLNAEEIVRGVQQRGVFKARKPEGKAGGDH